MTGFPGVAAAAWFGAAFAVLDKRTRSLEADAAIDEFDAELFRTALIA